MAGKYKVQIKNNDGTMSDLPLVATYDSGGNNIAATYAKKTEGIYYIKGTGTTAGTWTGSHADITAYYDGLTIAYHTNIAGAATTTLNINGLGAKTCYLRADSKVTTHYGVNTVVIFTYITVNGTGRWETADYDANSYAYVRQYVESANSELPIVMSHDTEIPSSYKTKYTGVVSGVTLNPSTKTISATAFKENGTVLSSKYVAQVSGKGLSTNDYTTTEKTKLSKAVTTDEAQTITGAKTFNANMTINGNSGDTPLTIKAAATGSYIGFKSSSNALLGYYGYSAVNTPVVYLASGGAKKLIHEGNISSYLANKADVYKTTASGGLRNIQVGDDLSGKTIYFDTTKDYNVWLSDPILVKTSNSNNIISSSISPPSLDINSYTTTVYNIEQNGWLQDSITLPSNAGTITSIQGPAGEIVKIEVTAEVSVDCEYNYNEIQKKADVYKKEGTKKLSEVRAGDNLSGVTLIFDTSTYPYVGSYIDFVTKDSSCPAYSKYRLGNRDDYGPGSGGYQFGLMEFVQMSEDGGWYQLGSNSTIFFNDNGSGGQDGWKMSSFTMPVSTGNDFVVEAVYIGTEENSFLDAIVEYGGTTTVDCEYNYKEIQILKEQVNNSSSGGGAIYMHSITVNYDFGSAYFKLFLSTADSINTAEKLYNIIGYDYTPVAISHMLGTGAGCITCQSGYSYTIYLYGYVSGGAVNETTFNSITDSIKQV